jgi:hypothetical protein
MEDQDIQRPIRIRNRILLASVAVPLFYAVFVVIHWILEDYFRLYNHKVYGILAPLVFLATILVVFVVSPVVSATTIVLHRYLKYVSLAALCVLMSLIPVLIVSFGIRLR